MSDSPFDEIQPGQNLNAGDSLRQALMRLTSPQVEELQRELDQLKKQITVISSLEGDTAELQKKLNNVNLAVHDIEKKFIQLGDELRDPAMIGQRLEETVVPALHKQVKSRGEDVANVLAPVIGPAIRHQIRDAKDDIINALYPVIGQIISKAISETLRELSRNIDARLRQQLNFRDRIDQLFGRLRGVSDAEFFLRSSLPYSIEHIFLIHRDTGILLEHFAVRGSDTGEMGTMSGMLTAIQDFVRDSFSGGQGDLEEVAHGDLRILLESGQFAYVAVVLSGIEPEGYNNLINEVVHEINIHHEGELKNFDGNMSSLPNFEPTLNRLLSPTESLLSESKANKPLSLPQKRFVRIFLVSIVLLMAFLIFACIFAIKLWPLAFPVELSSPTPTITITAMFLQSRTPTAVHTSTPTPMSTVTYMPEPSPTPTLQIGVLTGNLNVRAEPSANAPSLGVMLAGEKVIINDHQDVWFLISWPVNGETKMAGWIRGDKFLERLSSN